MNKRTFLICFFIVLILASFLRFTGLRDRGIFLCDEGDYLAGGRTVVAALDFAFKRIFSSGETGISFSEYLSEHGGGYASAVKPGYYLLVAISFLVGGVHDYSVLYLSAILGLLTILVTSLIGGLLYNRRVALYAAILLSFSVYHINYSRSTFSVAAVAFFLYLGVYFILKYFKDLKASHKDNPVSLILGGFALGYSFSCHYNLLATIGIMFLICGFFLFKYSKLGRLKHLIVSFITPLVLLEIPYWAVKYLTRGMTGVTTGKPYAIKSYFEQLTFIFNKTFFYTNRPQAPFFSYTDLLLKTEGAVVVLLFLVSCIFIIKRDWFRRETAGAVFLFTMGPLMFVFFSMLGEKAPRTILSVIPAFCVIAALFLADFEKRVIKIFKNRYIGYGLLVLPVWLCIIFSQFFNSLDYIKFRSPYVKAIEFIKRQGDYKHFSTSPPVSVFYAGLKNASPYWDMKLEEAKRLYSKEGYRFLILEVGEEGQRYRHELVDVVLRSGVRPAFEIFYNPLPLALEDLFFYTYKKGEPVIIYHRYEKDKPGVYPSVRVIDLKDIFG